VWDIPATEIALTGGVDVIEHGPQPEIAPDEMAAILASSDPLSAAHDILALQMDVWERQLAQMATQDVLFVPTLERNRWGMEQSATPKRESDLLIELGLARVRLFHERGGILALGTDTNTGLDERGFVLRELAFFEQAGLTPLEVIQAATHHAACACGQDEELGTLQRGRLADVIVVEGDPLAELRALDNIHTVIVDGEIACRKKPAR
jgi:imidazolonepropionase-like amidohydrolase